MLFAHDVSKNEAVPPLPAVSSARLMTPARVLEQAQAAVVRARAIKLIRWRAVGMLSAAAGAALALWPWWQYRPDGLTMASRTSWLMMAGGGLFLGGVLIDQMAAWAARRQMLSSLERAQLHEDRLEKLLALGNEFTWEMDAKARFTYVSPSFEVHTRRSTAEFMRIGEREGPQIVGDAQWELLNQDLRARRAYRNRVIHFLCQDGTDLFIHGNAEPIFDEQRIA